MKKNILVLAMAVIAAVGFNVSAQQQNCKKQFDKDKKECVKFKKDCRMGEGAFANLNLTEKQKEQLKALGESCKKAQRDSVKSKFEARKQEKRQMRADYLKQVKSILSAEQYVQYLENEYVNSGKDMRKGKMKGQDKCKKGKKGQGMKKDCRKGEMKSDKCKAQQSAEK